MTDTSNALVPMDRQTGVDTYRMSTDAAEICRAIVKATAKTIEKRQYVCVEGWQAIAVAHGCAASSRQVERIEGGFRAIGEVRRMSDGVVIAEAEGFVGEDEPVWFGGEGISYGKPKTYRKRPDYAIRAMTQTRAISRACRSAFAHVVVMIDASLSTTPAEEMSDLHGNGNEIDDKPDGLKFTAGWEGRHPPNGVDGPDSSWGPKGKQGAVDDAREDGLMDEPKLSPDGWAKVKKKVDDAVGTMNLSGQSVDSLDKFWKASKGDFDWIKHNVKSEYARLEKVYNDARDAAQARMPVQNTLMAG